MPEGSGSNAESLRGWMGAGAQRGQARLSLIASSGLTSTSPTPTASSTVPQVQSWESGKSRCQGPLLTPLPAYLMCELAIPPLQLQNPALTGRVCVCACVRVGV